MYSTQIKTIWLSLDSTISKWLKNNKSLKAIPANVQLLHLLLSYVAPAQRKRVWTFKGWAGLLIFFILCLESCSVSHIWAYYSMHGKGCTGLVSHFQWPHVHCIYAVLFSLYSSDKYIITRSSLTVLWTLPETCTLPFGVCTAIHFHSLPFSQHTDTLTQTHTHLQCQDVYRPSCPQSDCPCLLPSAPTVSVLADSWLALAS